MKSFSQFLSEIRDDIGELIASPIPQIIQFEDNREAWSWWDSVKNTFAKKDLGKKSLRVQDLVSFQPYLRKEKIKNSESNTPIKVYVTPDGRLMIYDGNHRAAYHLENGIEKIDAHVKKLIPNEDS